MSRHEQPIRKSLAPDSVRREVEDSLQRLHTDYIDLYQTHWPDKDTAVEDTMEALLDLKKQGKIRAIGVSNVTVELLKRYKALGAVATDQERYSMLDRKYEADLLPYCRENSIAFLAYSPLAMGLLTGKMGPDRRFKGDDVRNLDERFNVENRKRVQRMLEAFEPVADRHGITPAQLALAWTLRQPGVTHVLVGARNPAQAEENAGAGCVHLSDEDMAVMDQSIAAYAADIPRMSW
jgi:aryl-alcohol dehydrogenase-like predicted oxidoreductase